MPPCVVLYLEAGCVTVDLHVIEDHLSLSVEGLSAVGAQILLHHGSA